MFVHVPSRHRPTLRWATPLLVAVCMSVFVWVAGLDGPEARYAALQRWGAVSGSLPQGWVGWFGALTSGRLLSLVTAVFIHADWIHLLGNLLFLIIFALPIERALGSGRLLALFLLAGALANLGAAALMAEPSRIIIGASGAVSGVIGAYVLLFPGARLGFVLPLGVFLEFVRAPAYLLIGVWALLQGLFAYVGPAFGTVAWSAHVIGFGLGMLYALLLRRTTVRRRR